MVRFALIMLFWLGSIQLCAGQPTNVSQPLTVLLDDAYPPYSWQEGGESHGFYTRLAEMLFRRAGIPFEIQLYPWKRALSLVDRRKAALAGIYETPERRQRYHFSEPWFSEEVMVYVRREHGFHFEKIKDLRGKRVGVNRGWQVSEDFQDELQNQLFSVHYAANSQDNMKKLLAGRVDCVIVDKLNGDLMIAKLSAQDHIEVLPTPVLVHDSYIMLSRELPPEVSDNILSRINQEIAAMRADGSIALLAETFTKQ